MHKVLIERGAEKDLNTLDKKVRNRIIEHVLLLRKTPRSPKSKKLIGSNNAWRLRVGDWRVIYEIDDKTKSIMIYRIKHRSKAY